MTEPPRENPVTEAPTHRSQSTSWFAEGEAIRVWVGETEVVVRFLGRKGRRARISISAPAGAQFQELHPPLSNDGR